MHCLFLTSDSVFFIRLAITFVFLKKISLSLSPTLYLVLKKMWNLTTGTWRNYLIFCCWWRWRNHTYKRYDPLEWYQLDAWTSSLQEACFINGCLISCWHNIYQTYIEVIHLSEFDKHPTASYVELSPLTNGSGGISDILDEKWN